MREVTEQMTIEQIDTFLTAIETGSLNTAADRLFTSQSNASKRIHALEKELGFTLFNRAKGQRNLELTSPGKEFIPLAEQFKILLRQSTRISERSGRLPITIAGTTRLNRFTLLPFYMELIKNHPELQLTILTKHSAEIYILVESGEVDLAFATTEKRTRSINSTLLFTEQMIVISSGISFGKSIEPMALDPKREIYVRWSSGYEMWHDIYFPSHSYLACLDAGSMIGEHLLAQPDAWAIVPSGTLHAILQGGQFHYANIAPSFAPEIHESWLVENKNIKTYKREIIGLIKAELKNYLNREESRAALTFQVDP